MDYWDLIYKEFKDQGFADLEAVGAATTISTLPEVERLWNSLDGRRLVMKVAVDGMQPMSDQQQALVDGIAALTEKETEAYYMFLFEELSPREIGEKLGVGTKPIDKRIDRAKAKLAAAHQGPLDWKNDKRVLDVLHKLPEKRRKCFSLRYLEGLSVADVASKLDITPFTVKDVTKRAMYQIRFLINSNQQRNAL